MSSCILEESMHKPRLILLLLIFPIYFFQSLTSVLALGSEQDIKAAGAKVNVISENANNIFAAAARVNITGKANEDVYVAGALVSIDTQTNGNLYAAGSNVVVKGKIKGKAFIAGADLTIDADIQDELKAAAASIIISQNTKLATNSSLAAALIEFNGNANNELSLYADEVIFKGNASGSVVIEGRKVELDETATINGDLIIRSSEEAIISPDANITGKLTQLGPEDSKHADSSDGAGFILALSLSIFILGIVLIIFTRGFVEQGITMFRTKPGKSLLWGFVVFFGIPTFVILAMISIIGIPIGLAFLLLLPFLLLLGLTSASLALSDWMLNRKTQPKKTAQRLLFFALGVILLVLIGFIPIVGGVLIWLALLLGLGAVSITFASSLNKNVEAS